MITTEQSEKAIAYDNGEDWIFIQTERGTWLRWKKVTNEDKQIYRRILLNLAYSKYEDSSN